MYRFFQVGDQSLKVWEELSTLPCVKKYGWRHKIGHILGIQSQIRCIDGIAHCAVDGFVEGINRNINEEVTENGD